MKFSKTFSLKFQRKLTQWTHGPSGPVGVCRSGSTVSDVNFVVEWVAIICTTYVHLDFLKWTRFQRWDETDTLPTGSSYPCIYSFAPSLLNLQLFRTVLPHPSPCAFSIQLVPPPTFKDPSNIYIYIYILGQESKSKNRFKSAAFGLVKKNVYWVRLIYSTNQFSTAFDWFANCNWVAWKWLGRIIVSMQISIR